MMRAELGSRAAVSLGVLARRMGARCPRLAAAVAVERLATDSRQVTPGTLFFAVRGHRDDGGRFLEEAVRRGAVAVVAEAPLANAGELPVLVVPCVRSAKALAAHAFHDDPARGLLCVGITGTNGKTTTAAMLHSVLSIQGSLPTLIGTTGVRFGDGEARASGHTTPDPLDLAEILAETRRRGGRAVVMEVSSHALAQHRTDGIPFGAAVFTQLSREHLDYHRTMEEYRDVKGRLFRDLGRDAVAVLNAEDRCSFQYLSETRARALTYGLAPGVDVTARVRRLDIDGIAFDLRYRGRTVDVTTRLIGRHNLMNALAAAAAALALDVDPACIQGGFEALRSVPGRLEPVDRGQDFRVLVDYAHTDDALEKVLHVLRPLTRGRMITVFGCGGDRDRGKRPRMGRVASTLSDLVFLTSDNPRSEDPAVILEEILQGVVDRARVAVVPDRREAITRALQEAHGGDIVLIAGKGHENVQIIGEQRMPFDDRAVAEEVLWRVSS